MTVLCPTCHGRGSVPNPSIAGPMYYSDPNGWSWPQVICQTCGGTGRIRASDAARTEPVTRIEIVWEPQCNPGQT